MKTGKNYFSGGHIDTYKTICWGSAAGRREPRVGIRLAWWVVDRGGDQDQAGRACHFCAQTSRAEGAFDSDGGGLSFRVRPSSMAWILQRKSLREMGRDLTMLDRAIERGAWSSRRSSSSSTRTPRAPSWCWMASVAKPSKASFLLAIAVHQRWTRSAREASFAYRSLSVAVCATTLAGGVTNIQVLPSHLPAISSRGADFEQATRAIGSVLRGVRRNHVCIDFDTNVEMMDLVVHEHVVMSGSLCALAFGPKERIAATVVQRVGGSLGASADDMHAVVPEVVADLSWLAPAGLLLNLVWTSVVNYVMIVDGDLQRILRAGLRLSGTTVVKEGLPLGSLLGPRVGGSLWIHRLCAKSAPSQQLYRRPR